MKRKGLLVGFAAAAAALLLVSLLAIARVWGANPREVSQGVDRTPQAAAFLPKQSPLAVSLFVDPDRLARLARLTAPATARAGIRNDVAQLKRSLERTWGLNYDRDVRPWVGKEISLAVTTTDLDRDPSNGLQPGYLLALAIDKNAPARSTFDALWQRRAIAGSDLSFEQYQGIPIVAAKATRSLRPLAGAIVGNFFLLGNDRAVIRNAINDVQVSNLSLAGFDAYRRAVERLSDRRIGVAYANLAQVAAWGHAIGTLPAAFAQTPPASVVVGVAARDRGLTAEAILQAETLPALLASSGKDMRKDDLLALLPAGSSAMVGRNLGGTWEQVREALQVAPDLANLLSGAIAEAGAPLGLNPEADLFPWVKEYGLALLPDGRSWLLVTRNGSDTSAALSRLDDRARAQFTVGTVPVGDRNLTVWTQLRADSGAGDLAGTVVLARLELPGYTLFATAVAPLRAVLDNKSAGSLATYRPFARIRDRLAAPTANLVYLDSQGWGTLLSSLQSILPDNVDSVLHRLRAVGIETVTPTGEEASFLRRGRFALDLQ